MKSLIFSFCRRILLSCFILGNLSFPPFAHSANEELGFLERFALSSDRASVLKELVPGTEEFYYYSALLAQQEGRLDAVPGLLEPWVKRHGESPRVIEIRNRQALLRYSDNPEETLGYLRKKLGLQFNHQQKKLDAKPDFPTALPPEKISWDAYFNRSKNQNSLGSISESGLDRLIRDEVVLNPAQRRELLSRLQFPDYERLVGLIAADLRTRESRGFGEFEIHRRLTLAQLDELLGLRTELAKNTAFVDARLIRLRPNEDVSLDRQPEERKAYLDRLWEYVSQLEPSFNSLKASVLYQRLELGRENGEFSVDDFLAYLRLPRPMPYMEPRFLQQEKAKGFSADLTVDFSSTTGFTPIRNDESLVRSYLEHFFLTEETFNRYAPYLRETWLKEVFAETKLIHGIGDPERWYSLLTPSRVQALKDRVKIEFSPGNQDHFAAGEDVSLTVHLKNIPELIVKVYEINSLNYFLDQKRELNTDLNLDGLIANEETSYRYDQVPIRQHTEVFSFESIKERRGAWVVEFIGNGISSRALVRKGKLQFLSVTTPGGELIQVLTEANQKVEKPSVWFGGKHYDADENGFVLLPFSTAGNASIVLSDGELASFASIALPGEEYQFDAGIFLEQETLLPGREAVVAVRPKLTLNGEPVTTSLLEEVTVRVETVDLDGVESVSEANDFALSDNEEAIHRFRVPSRLRAVSVYLSAKIELVSEPGKKRELSSVRHFDVNAVEEERRVSDLYLSRFGDRYVLALLGKSGEAISERPVNVSLTHDDFGREIEVVLKTNPDGRIDLGKLEEIASIRCRIDGVGERNWSLLHDRYSHPDSLHAVAGEPVVFPLPETGDALTRGEFAIFEVRSGVPVRDAFEKASVKDGLVSIRGIEPGDYQLLLKRSGKSLRLRVTESDEEAFGYALSETRHLQEEEDSPLLISSLAQKGGKIEIAIRNANDLTRVHLVATRFLPQFDPYALIGFENLPPLYQISRGTNDSLYVSGRDIGEEYRYILERRTAKRYPGNLLSRPGLILNPWALNETETEVDDAEKGEAYKRSRDMKEAKRTSAPKKAPGREEPSQRPWTSPSFQFLAQQAVFLTNLKPGEDGAISIDLADLGDRQHVHVLAVDGTRTAYRQLSLPEPEDGTGFRDLRLSETLDREKTFTQRRNVTLLKAGQTLTIEDLRAAELEAYGTIGEVYGTLLAMNADPNFQKFGFLTNWTELEGGKKKELYSEFASHELNFFLSRKDPEFFAEVIQPYLQNKKEKTFLDLYLVEAPLDEFLAPWQFGRLNIVERILLASRIGEDERKRTADHVRSLEELTPPDVAGRARVFRQALRGRRSSGGALGLNEGAVVDAFADTNGAVVAPAAAKLMVRRSALPVASSAAPAGAGGEEMAKSADKVNGLRSVAPRGANIAGRQLMEAEDLRRKAAEHVLYRKLESTREWAENNYYHLPIAAQNADLVSVNSFWEDYAEWNGEGGFYSREFAGATSNFTEMMFTLSVLDLPFSSEEHDLTVEENRLQFTANSPVVIFHEEIREAPRSEEETPILVSQNFFRADDRYRYVEGQQLDKFVTDEFLTSVVYGSQIVATNPTSSAHTLELLVQIPSGAIPVTGSDYTKSYPVTLNPFSTERIEVEFYFPKPSGDKPFEVYPVQVAKNEEVIATGSAASFKVVERPTQFDEASWEYLSQYGTEKEVLDYLSNNNLYRINLGSIAWRVRESVDFFRKATEVIASRHAYDATLWSYGLHHNQLPAAREYLKHREDFLSRSGRWIETELVSLDPVERKWYQHLEYAPLVNARAHQLGRNRKILNDRFRSQYDSFLKVLSYKPEAAAEDQLAVAGYLFLQDRIEEGLTWLDLIDADAVQSRLQYDYLRAYAAFYEADGARAKQIAAAYLDHPVERWQARFAKVDSQVSEVGGQEAAPSEEENREEQLEKLSSSDPSFELSAEGREVKVAYRNLRKVEVNYYEMDLEFLFSSKPFVSGGSGQFSFIRPNLREEKDLPADGDALQFEVPEQFASKNVLVEIVAAGRSEAVAVYSNLLKVQLSENYGRVEVRHENSDKPLPRIYVKVYARMKDGAVRFFKDGYTDLRGKFDYVSLNTGELDDVERLSLLVMSEKDGSLVREVSPPQR